MLDLKQLTADVCRIATEAGHFLKEERKNLDYSLRSIQHIDSHAYS
jgi:hypothetical protein